MRQLLLEVGGVGILRSVVKFLSFKRDRVTWTFSLHIESYEHQGIKAAGHPSRWRFHNRRY